MFFHVLLLALIGSAIAHELFSMEPHFKSSEQDNIQLSATGGGFPTNPTYGVVNYYSDYKCSNPTKATSILLNTCLVAKSGAAFMSTCCKKKS
jgi:hypothetical protein